MFAPVFRAGFRPLFLKKLALAPAAAPGIREVRDRIPAAGRAGRTGDPMSHKDVITLPMLLSRMPRIVKRLPKMVQGVKLGNITDKTQPVGLGLCLQDAVSRNPNGTAIMYRDTHLTYRQFNEWANRIANHLAAQGVKKGDVVAVFVENRPELLAIVAGVAKLGAINAMLNTQQTGKVLTHSFNLVKPRIAIVGEELVQPFQDVREHLEIGANDVFWFADTNTLEEEGTTPAGFRNLATESRTAPTHNPDSVNRVYIEDPLFYIYTSGTTGLPKAVIFNQGRWMKAYGGFGLSAMQLEPRDRIYVTLPFYHATGMCVCWGSALAGAAGLVMARKFSASRFWDDIRRYDATAFGYVGELCRYLMEQPEKPNDPDHKVVKIIGNGMRPNVWGPFKKRFGIEEVYELYASSEGNVGFMNLFNFDNTVGFTPIPYAIVRYDKENERPFRNSKGFMEKVGKGEVGLLIGEITDKSPFKGYTDPEKTEKVILRDVFKKGDSFFNTGDLMRDIGFKHAQFVDRTGDTFRWKGENVSTTEVENILDGFPGVVETVVYGVEIPNTNGRCGMASIRLTVPEAKFDFKGLAGYLRRELPAYAVPLFLRLSEAMDTTGTFKHQKSKLKDDGFSLDKVGTPVYALLPGSDEFIRLTPEIETSIAEGRYRF
jgi:citronellyl-CoA synthetase